MGKIRSLNGKFINYFANDKCIEEIIGEGMILKSKKMNPFSKRADSLMFNAGNSVNPVRTSSRLGYQKKQKPIYGYQHIESRLKYSFTPDSVMDEEPRSSVISTSMSMAEKRNNKSKNFFSSLTKKLLPTKSNSITRRCSTSTARSIIKKKSIKEKYVNTNNNINNIINIPMQVIETLYTISFTKHSYYIQRSLRRSTMIVNLITKFRNTYKELREIDTPKLKRRISFKKRVPKVLKKEEQPKEGSLVELRMQRQAKYYQIYGYSQPFDLPKRRKSKVPQRPLLDFSDCETLPAVPTCAAGSKVNQYLTTYSELERKKLKPIKSINRELCSIFNKEYIPEEQIEKKEEEEEEDDDIAIGKIQLNRGGSLDDLREVINYPNLMDLSYIGGTSPMYSKHTSIDINNLLLTPMPNFANLPMNENVLGLSTTLYTEPEEEKEEEDEEEEEESFEESESDDEEYDSEDSEEDDDEEEEEDDEEEEEEEDDEEDIRTVTPSIAEAVELEIAEEKKEASSKRISEGTLYNESFDCSSNLSDDSNLSDITLNEDDMQSIDSSFVVIDDDQFNNSIKFHFESEEEDNNMEADQSFLLDKNGHENEEEEEVNKENEKEKENSFSLTDSFLLVNEKNGENTVPEYMTDFLLNNGKFSVSSFDEDDLYNSSMSILNNSIINESFSLSLGNYGDENKSKSKLEDALNTVEKPLNRIDSGIDLNCMNNVSYLMERKCQI